MAVRDLLDILSWQRGAGTRSHATFVHQKIATIPGIQQDGYGNYHLQVGDEDPIILWSCHTDTVTKNEGRQNVKWIAKDVLGLNNGRPGQCLGADDGAGIWLMLEMIAAGKPGYYVFHADEEIGGLGSSYLKDNPQYFPPTLKIAIAMDRSGTSDVITHQGFSRCCSDAFARSLAAQLGGTFRPDDTGVFTDTANYTGLIAECTNLSVGYESNHGPREVLDVAHLKALREALINLDQSKLVIEREPGEEDDMWSNYSGGHYYYPSSPNMGGYDNGGTPPFHPKVDYADIVRNHPGIAARLLEELGVEVAEFRAHVFAFSGQLYEV